MSQYPNRVAMRATKKKLEAHGCLTAEIIREEMEAIRQISSNPHADWRTRMMAKKFLLSHDWEVYAHQNPATQKIEQKIEIQGVIRLPPKKAIGEPVELVTSPTPS